MKAPIIINDSRVFERSGDLGVYRSVRRAEHACEPWAAEDQNISAFDSEGRLLNILPMQSEGRIRLEPATEAPEHLDVLRGLLQDFLIKTGAAEAETSRMSVPAMLATIYARDPDPDGWDPDAPQKPGFFQSLLQRLRGIFTA